MKIKIILKKKILVLLFLLNSYIINSQEHFRNVRISPVLSHTYIPKATNDGDKTVIVPSIGLDIEYWFNKKWGIGFHNQYIDCL